MTGPSADAKGAPPAPGPAPAAGTLAVLPLGGAARVGGNDPPPRPDGSVSGALGASQVQAAVGPLRERIAKCAGKVAGQGALVRSNNSSTRASSLPRVSLMFRCLGPDASAVM